MASANVATPVSQYQSLLPTTSGAGASKAETPYSKTTETAPITSTESQTQSQFGSGTRTTDTSNMDSQSLAALQNLIGLLQTGGTKEIQAESAKRKQTISLVEQLMGQVSTGQAMTDAQAAMALNLQTAMEQQMPAISKAIEGAGTSASSMQALLSQKLARDSSLAAGALGAAQAQTYAQQRTGLANTLEALTRPTSAATSALISALNVAKGAVTSTRETSSQSGTSTFAGTKTTAPQKVTETYSPLSNVTPLAPTPTSGGMDWIQAMASSRDKNTGNVDWVKAAGLLG